MQTRATKSMPEVKPTPLPDAAAMRQFLKQHGRRAATQMTEDAQTLMYDAWEAKTPAARTRRARKALALSPLCADAYVLLSHAEAKSDAEKLAYLRLGVTAGELALGKAGFRDYAGEFWGWLETRPYMRARAGVAEMLRRLGDTKGAIAEHREMLKLNPNDNQGARYPLLADLLISGDNLAATKLLEEYDEFSIFCLYSKILLKFRNGEPDDLGLAKAALEANPHVAGILAGTTRNPGANGGFVTVGSPGEAAYYIEETGAAWHSPPDAIARLTALMAAAKR